MMTDEDQINRIESLSEARPQSLPLAGKLAAYALATVSRALSRPSRATGRDDRF